MSPGDDDRRIREALGEAHRDDRIPSFERTWADGRRGRTGARRRRSIALVAGVVAIATTGAWFALRPAPPAPATWAPTGTRWNGPTDFLLRTPDLMTLRTLPPLDPAAAPWTTPSPGRRGLP